MKVVILAGGHGTRLSEETQTKPKPMVEIGGKPMLWHIMKIYSHYGFNDFIVCLGHKGHRIKEYFANYFLYQSNVTIDLAQNKVEIHNSSSEPWNVTLVDTGEHTMTGGRILRVREYLGNETFMMTYGDGVADVRIDSLIEFHRAKRKFATITAGQPTGRFGALLIDTNNSVTRFQEKPAGDGSWVNAGFFVLEPAVFEYIEGDLTVFEGDPLRKLAQEGELVAYKHKGFWQPMDTLRDKLLLENLWNSRTAPWELWK